MMSIENVTNGYPLMISRMQNQAPQHVAEPISIPDMQSYESEERLCIAPAVVMQAFQGYVEAVMVLVDADPTCVHSRDEEGNTALLGAAFEGHAAICEYLLGRGADVDAANDSYGWTPAIAAAYSGDVATLAIILAYNPDVNRVDYNGKSALDYAREEGMQECCAMLSDAGAKSGSACSATSTGANASGQQPTESSIIDLPKFGDFSITYRFGAQSQFIDPENPSLRAEVDLKSPLNSKLTQSRLGKTAATPMSGFKGLVSPFSNPKSRLVNMQLPPKIVFDGSENTCQTASTSHGDIHENCLPGDPGASTLQTGTSSQHVDAPTPAVLCTPVPALPATSSQTLAWVALLMAIFAMIIVLFK